MSIYHYSEIFCFPASPWTYALHLASQGSVVTRLRCDRIITLYCKFTSESAGERIWKSVNIWQSYGQHYTESWFFDSQYVFECKRVNFFL